MAQRSEAAFVEFGFNSIVGGNLVLGSPVQPAGG